MKEHPAARSQLLRERFMRSAGWATALRWSLKGFGIVSTAFLARLLTPADFGLVAMAMIVISFVDVWSDIGVEYALIQNQNPTAASYHTAWTLRLIQAFVVATIVVLIAPLAAIYFKEPRVETLLWVLAGAPVLGALRNIGTIDFRKHLRLDKEFKLQITSKLLTVVITIACAWYIRSFWALVAGMLLGKVIDGIGSYIIHPFRPRLSLQDARSFRGYWLATLANGLGYFTEGKLDEVLVGRFGSTSTMGVYSLSSEFGQLPVSEVAGPLNRALVPTMSMLQSEAGRVAAAFLNFMRALAFIIVPAGFGLALVAGPFIRVVLGEQWVGGALVMQILAIFGIFRATILAGANALVGLGRPGVSAQFSWISVLALLVGGIALAPAYGVTGIACARLVGGLLVMSIVLFRLQRVLQCPASRLLACYVRPCISSAVMAVAVLSVQDVGGIALANLLTKIAAGAGVYFASTFLLWQLAGRPDGVERMIVDQVVQLRTALATR